MAQASAATSALSLVTDYGENRSSCGYCGRRSHSSVSHGMMADTMSVECYQELLDRGWRRSGRWVYYPLQDRSCCQLLTIRLDVARFTPNKEQRRVLRKWQAHLEGAPLRSEQQQQQQKPESLDHSSQQQAAGISEHSSQQQQQADAEQHRNLVGGSPKRPHADLADSLQWGDPWEEGGHPEAGMSGLHVSAGSSKRHRAENGHVEGDTLPDEESLRGSSPTAQLTDKLLHAFRSDSLPLGSGELHPHSLDAQQAAVQRPQEGAGPVPPVPSPADGAAAVAEPLVTEATLSSQLAAALQQAVAAGQLPIAPYPPARVQRPSSKQRRLLPPGVTFTTAYPLAAAAAASKAATGSSSADGRIGADQVAEVLLQQLPTELAATSTVVRGHINFASASAAGSEQASPAATSVSQSLSQQQQSPQLQKQHRQQSPLQQDHQQQQQQQQQQQSTVGAPGIPRGVPRHFELRTLPANEPSLTEVEFQLFKKYQVVHHGDKPAEVTPRSFKRFLVDTPLRRAGPEAYPAGACPPLGFGSFHQQYWLDGRLVAVGVVDILPRCLSSKYLFWDPDLAPLSLGKLTSLKEIEWVREQSAACASLRYYYLGFYIHTCHRMRYKGDFAPSDLLCPRNKCWVPLSRVQQALDQPGMVAISEVPGALEGLGAEHRVDAATGAPACPPREPSDAELSRMRVLLRLPGAQGRQARILTLGLMQQLGMIEDAQEALMRPIRLWWSRAGPTAASMIAFTDI